VTWAKASRWCTRYALASAWESALLLPHERGWARSLDDGILVKQRGRERGLSRQGYPVRLDHPVMLRGRRHDIVFEGASAQGAFSLDSPRRQPRVPSTSTSECRFNKSLRHGDRAGVGELEFKE